MLIQNHLLLILSLHIRTKVARHNDVYRKATDEFTVLPLPQFKHALTQSKPNKHYPIYFRKKINALYGQLSDFTIELVTFMITIK
jgi:hypothetical protein